MASLAGVPAFVHVAEQRSYREASRILGVTPTAVSKAVARLEARLGLTLLKRTSRSVALTPEGEEYLRACREALDRIQGAEDRLTRAAEVAQGPLTVSAPRIFGRRLIGQLDRLLARHPRLEVRLSFSDREVRLAEEDVDLAIRVGDLRDSTLLARRLRSPSWVTVAAPSHVARWGTPSAPSGLAAHACLRFARPAGGVTDWRFRRSPDDPEPEAFRSESALVLDDGDLLVDAAVAGLGVVQVFDFMVAERIRRGELVELLEGWRATGPPVHALTIAGRQDVPKVRAFLDFSVEVLGGRSEN